MARRGALIAALTLAVVTGAFVLLLALSDTQRTGSVSFEVVGDVAPDFAGSTLDGGFYDLAAQRGDWVVVNFFASWCVGCRVEHPELVEFSERHRDTNVQLVAVMFGDTERAAREFFRELGGDWPALVEDTGGIAIDYGVTAVPETLLIAPSGRVIQKWIGANGVTADQLEATIVAAGGPSGA
jgi:cytochrome c biogenesis protein CcmG/thiol:disulfide interchange protein DsbE